MFFLQSTGNLINGQRVEVIPDHVIVKEGGSTQLTCRFGKNIKFCLFTINGSAPISVDDNYNNNGIRYTGSGLANGECGITIDRVLNENNGQAKCTLGVDGAVGGLVEGFIQIIVASKYLIKTKTNQRTQITTISIGSAEPHIQVESSHRNGVFTTEVPLKAACIVENARPQAQIQWFLDDQPITRSLGRPINQETAPGEFSSRQDIEYRLAPEDDGKSLICKAVQFQDDNENRIAKQQLSIQCKKVFPYANEV